MRRRKVSGRRKRRKGDNKRIVRGEDAMRTRNGTEMARTATSTTEVTLSVCIESGADDTRQTPVLPSRLLYSRDKSSLDRRFFVSAAMTSNPRPLSTAEGFVLGGAAASIAVSHRHLASSLHCLTISSGYFFKSRRSRKNKVATSG
jgi:hypothetical protein